MEHDLLSEIRDFLAQHEMSASYFGKRAVNNSELVGRLERGSTVTLATAEKVRAYMRERGKAAA
jgi:hypothetical protein